MSSAIAAAPSHSRSRCWSRNAGWPPATRNPSHTPSPSTKPASKTLTTAWARGTSSPLTLTRISALRGSSAWSCVPCAAVMFRSSRSRPRTRPRRAGRRRAAPGRPAGPGPARRERPEAEHRGGRGRRRGRGALRGRCRVSTARRTAASIVSVLPAMLPSWRRRRAGRRRRAPVPPARPARSRRRRHPAASIASVISTGRPSRSSSRSTAGCTCTPSLISSHGTPRSSAATTGPGSRWWIGRMPL